jgi:hypothetical protein
MLQFPWIFINLNPIFSTEMSGRIKIIAKWTWLLIFLVSLPLKAQLLQDTAALNLVKKDVDHIYNLQFNEAREDYAMIARLYPEHPIVFLLRGMMTYWENYPLLHTSDAHVSFEEDMRKCIRLSEANTTVAYEAEYLLADLCARGLLLMFYDDNDLILEVTPLTISTYKYLRRAFDFTSRCSDLYYFTGTYNYYREAYPKIYPVYKSLAFLFPHGNLEAGLKQLQKAAINSVVLNAESAYLLIWIYMGYENKLPESLYYCKTLHEKYPDNDLYLGIYIRNLLLMKHYDEADKLLSSDQEESGNKFFQAQLTIIKGIIQEKKYHNKKLAEQYYNIGISLISVYGKYGNEYAAYAYFGLSRVSDDSGEKHTRKIYRKEALKLAEFKKIDFDK